MIVVAISMPSQQSRQFSVRKVYNGWVETNSRRKKRMVSSRSTAKDIDEYIASFPAGTQEILENVRAAIREAAPEAKEKISYGIPTFTLQGNLVHFGGYSKHIGFYPTPSGIEKFKRELSVYKGAKGSVQFPLDEPIPYDLIRQIVSFRVHENLEKAEMKKKKK
jgi:uncharacterized protein YdhG (YjbR/CyaY superfamily)